MAASIPWEILEADSRRRVTVLDPMAGSGTVPVVARSLGHVGLGFDVDPLAVLIASTWSADVAATSFVTAAERVVARSTDWKSISLENSYPSSADADTRKFIRYWFDARSRRQLTRLASSIEEVRDPLTRDLLWCAFSRLIIVKQSGASRAMDAAHSRPHRSYPSARIQPIDHFLRAVRHIAKAAPFNGGGPHPQAKVEHGDARRLRVRTSSIDYVITSPPYLNAIDYLRGHRLSLVWMGHSVKVIRGIRADSVGTEAGHGRKPTDPILSQALSACLATELANRDRGVLVRFLEDMLQVLKEVRRVLKPTGRAIFVVGNCNVRGTFISNSAGIIALARAVGLRKTSQRTRELPANRRYLPPPGNGDAGDDLAKRMREEVVITFART